MSRLPSSAYCVESEPVGRHRLSAPDVVVVVVIAVLASVLAAGGLAPSAIFEVLGAAASVALGVLLTLRGGSGAARLVIQGMRVGFPG
ncbi:hypothetical protein [Streptomyces axinellae]|uniref:Uncharacterized protein n=1 Tax=Streptomyces axinellae TaxID=552788 RepID=A0ABP6BZS2_9ACTN